MKLLGFTNRDVERKLGLSASYLSRLFSGLIELRVSHIADIARVLGVEPEEIFHLAFPERKTPASAAAARLRESILGGKSPGKDAVPKAASAGDDSASELEQALEKLMARSLQKVLARMG
jgi:transcriptional regulator with XRE-family HTH domain